MSPFEYRGQLSEQAHNGWMVVLMQLMTMQLAVAQEKQIAVGRGVYRDHVRSSKHPAHE